MEKNNQKLIQDVKERLAWYTLEASEEEFDETEVEALVQLLTVLEGGKEEDAKESREALERFWKFRDKRMAEEGGRIAGESRRLPEGAALAENGKKHNARGRKRAVRRWYMPAAAAAVVFLVVAGGSIGSMAVKDNGYFYWLKRDENGATFITNPESLDAVTEQPSYSKSYKPEEVPAEYKEYVVDAEVTEAIEALQNYELQEVHILEEENIKNVNSFLINQGTEEELSICVEIFPYKRLRVHESYGSNEYEYGAEQGGMEYELFSKPNPTGGTDYVVTFYVENKRYTLSNHDNDRQLIEIAEQYYHYIAD